MALSKSLLAPRTHDITTHKVQTNCSQSFFKFIWESEFVPLPLSRSSMLGPDAPATAVNNAWIHMERFQQKPLIAFAVVVKATLYVYFIGAAHSQTVDAQCGNYK